MAKKTHSASRKTTGTARKRRVRKPAKRDSSRLDLGPLQDHIKKRIKDLEGQATPAAAKEGDDTTLRLKQTLQLLEDLCFPTMTVPI